MGAVPKLQGLGFGKTLNLRVLWRVYTERYQDSQCLGVQVFDNLVFGALVLVIVVQVLGMLLYTLNTKILFNQGGICIRVTVPVGGCS